jgi:hypothetical protein
VSVGGHIIEMKPVILESGKEAVRLRVMDATYGDETHVLAEPWTEGLGPSMGEEVWWQGGKIYFNRDRCHVRKIGYSGDAHRYPNEWE